MQISSRILKTNLIQDTRLLSNSYYVVKIRQNTFSVNRLEKAISNFQASKILKVVFRVE